MFHRKRFRSAIAIILTLLLTVAIVPVAVAADPPPPVDDIDESELPPPPVIVTPEPPVIVTPEPSVTVTPEPPVIVTPEPPDMGDGNGDGNGNMMTAPSSWPPPNAIVHHAATPIQISALGGGLHVYFIGPDGASNSGTVIGSFSTLAETYPSGDAVSLYTGTNAGSGKSVNIEYLPTEMKIRVSTYYADQPPHDYNKPYVFIIDADHSVTHESW